MPSGEGLGGLAEDDVRAALDELLAWETMRRSPQLAAFLRYITEATLRGDDAGLKAYSIAVDVLGRGEDFDPQTDPIVRVQARRLRSLLATFYGSGKARAPVEIDLPVGRYVPEFKAREGRSEEALSVERNIVPVTEGGQRNVWIVGLIAFAVLLAAIVFWPSLSQRTATLGAVAQPAMPVVIVQEFENLASDELGAPVVAGLAVELVTDFNRFPDLSARYGGVQAALSPAEMAVGTPLYLLSGVARRVPDGIRYGVLLTDGTAEAVLANVDLTVPLTEGRPAMLLDDVSRHIALRIGSPRGVLHQPARRWLAEEGASARLDLYPCLVAFWLYLERQALIEPVRVRQCAEDLAPHHGEARAMLAVLVADEAWQLGPDTASGQERLSDATALALEAREADPTSALAWWASAHVGLVDGDLQGARDSFNSAYQLNPAEVDMVAAYAQLLGQIGNWQAALGLSRDAMAAEPDPPGWYFLTLAMHALRAGEYRQAIADAMPTISAYPDLGAAILVAAGAAARDIDVVNAYLPRLLASQRYRRLGILPALRHQISDPELLRQLSSGLSIAGIPLDRLARPF